MFGARLDRPTAISNLYLRGAFNGIDFCGTLDHVSQMFYAST